MALTACKSFPTKTEVIVLVPPKLVFNANIKDFGVHVSGPADCAKHVQNGIEAAAVKGELAPIIEGLRYLDGPLVIDGTVEDCLVEMGRGRLKGKITFSHETRSLHHELVSHETNRPGASRDEVRDVLVKQAVRQVESVFVPIEKKEVRDLQGSNGPILVALYEKNFGHALELLTEWLRKDPKDFYAWFNSGIAHEGLKQCDKAVESYQRASDLNSSEEYSRRLSRAKKDCDNYKMIQERRQPKE
jgi:tetratricopeptide (TPR) repeat protein